MTQFESLQEMFEYDLWANRLWLDCLASKGWPHPDRSVFEHMLSAQEIWRLRCRGECPTAMPDVEPTPAELGRITADWKKLLVELEDDPIISYKRTTGEAMESRFSNIAQHVCNHGTYHRGELRGLCNSRNDLDFPETDFIRYVMELG